MTKEAPSLIEELITEGAPFDRDEFGQIKLALKVLIVKKELYMVGEMLQVKR